MRIAYRITENDFLEAQKLYLATSQPGQRLFRKVIIIMGSILFAAGVVSRMSSSPQLRGDLFPGIPAGAAMVFVFWLMPRLSAKKMFSHDKRLQNNIIVDFSESGMNISTGNSSATISWADCVRYIESANLFVVFQSPQLFNAFPKRAFASGETDEFRQLLNRRLPASS